MKVLPERESERAREREREREREKYIFMSQQAWNSEDYPKEI